MNTTNMTITDKTTADLSGTISFPGSIINTTPNPYIGMASTCLLYTSPSPRDCS